MFSSRLISLVMLAAAVACTAKTDSTTDSTSVSTSTSVGVDSASQVTTPPLSPAPVPTPPDASPPPVGTTWKVTASGIAPLRTGMTVAQAASRVGGGFAAPAGYSGGCGYAVLRNAPPGLAVMLEDGKIARFEVRSGGIATAAGARIGDSEARVVSLYPGRVTSTPHKYVQGGHYLTVTSPGDAANRIVFETDGSKVTEYRAGRTPAVELVERCG